jgi:murein endopeptidase
MNVDVLLPINGPGFVTNNRGNNQFQFGQQSTIDAAIRVAASWNEKHPNRPFSIGQISKKGGGPMPPHKSHQLGVDVDVRPMRKDGENAPATITDSQFDRESTTELIKLWWRLAPTQAVFFNDQSVIDAGLSRFVNGHHNHFHVRLRMKGDTLRIGDKGSDVAEVQERLGLLEPDGVFGSTMLQAVEAFQAAHQLNPDGVVGPKTFKALGMD